MEKPPLDPPVPDTAPTEPVLTGYDEQHLVTCVRLLDAEIDGADWREVAKVVLKIDPDSNSNPCFSLETASWVKTHRRRILKNPVSVRNLC